MHMKGCFKTSQLQRTQCHCLHQRRLSCWTLCQHTLARPGQMAPRSHRPFSFAADLGTINNIEQGCHLAMYANNTLLTGAQHIKLPQIFAMDVSPFRRATQVVICVL